MHTRTALWEQSEPLLPVAAPHPLIRAISFGGKTLAELGVCKPTAASGYQQISMSQGVPSGWISEYNHDDDKSMSHLKVTFKTCQLLGWGVGLAEGLSDTLAKRNGAVSVGGRSGAQRQAHAGVGTGRDRRCRYVTNPLGTRHPITSNSGRKETAIQGRSAPSPIRRSARTRTHGQVSR